MASFSETLFRSKLNDLVPTEASIRQLSLWLIHHRRHAPAIVKTWFEELQNAAKVERKITLLYLVNDVVQNSRKKGPEFSKGFSEKIIDAYKDVISHDKVVEKQIGSLDRMVKVWAERKVFPSDFITKVKHVIAKYGVRAKAKKRAAAVAAGGDNAAAVTKEASIISEKKKKYEEALDDVVFELTGSPKDTSASNDVTPASTTTTPAPPSGGGGENNSADSAPEMSEVMELVKGLMDCASGDEPVRKQIADLPQEVADPKALDKIETETAAEALYQRIEQACVLLADYNRRLEEEMEDRRKLSSILPPFIQALKEGLAKREQELQDMRARLARVSAVRAALLEHMTNLPDIQHKPTNPLPEVADLFG